MKSIIVNNNFWKKKTMFINILAIFAVLLLVLIEQMKTEGVAIKIVEKKDQLISGKKLFLTRFSMAQTNEASKTKIKKREVQEEEESMDDNNEGQKAEDLRGGGFRFTTQALDEQIRGQIVFMIILIVLCICYIFCGIIFHFAMKT